MANKASGRILIELPIKRGTTINGKDWEKREYVMETNERYQTKMKFSLYSWDGPIENPPKIGDKVEISFSIEAKENKGFWYNEVKPYNIEIQE